MADGDAVSLEEALLPPLPVALGLPVENTVVVGDTVESTVSEALAQAETSLLTLTTGVSLPLLLLEEVLLALPGALLAVFTALPLPHMLGLPLTLGELEAEAV